MGDLISDIKYYNSIVFQPNLLPNNISNQSFFPFMSSPENVNEYLPQ